MREKKKPLVVTLTKETNEIQRVITFEVGQMLRFLLGPLEGHIHDLKLIDVSEDFPSKPKPNRVAATLVELKKIEP